MNWLRRLFQQFKRKPKRTAYDLRVEREKMMRAHCEELERVTLWGEPKK